MESAARRLYALGFCAFTVPAVLLLPRAGWLWAGAASAMCALFLGALIVLRRQCGHGVADVAGRTVFGRVCLLPALLWNLLALGATARQLCAAYPTGTPFPLVGVLLLVLAAYAAQRGEGVVLRTAAVVFFALVVFYALILGFSVPKLHFAWLAPQRNTDWRLLPSVLSPAVVLYLGGAEVKGKPLPWLALSAAFATLCAAVAAGSLSPAVAAGEPFPFYTAAKSVSVLGAMERLEPLVSAALTAGGFCLLALLCAANGRIVAAFLPRAEKFTALLNLALGGGAVWLSGMVPPGITAAGTAIFWGLFPFFTLFLGSRKKL